jgi:hypothetical protein
MLFPFDDEGWLGGKDDLIAGFMVKENGRSWLVGVKI